VIPRGKTANSLHTRLSPALFLGRTPSLLGGKCRALKRFACHKTFKQIAAL
jgi:hypothetical protein